MQSGLTHKCAWRPFSVWILTGEKRLLQSRATQRPPLTPVYPQLPVRVPAGRPFLGCPVQTYRLLDLGRQRRGIGEDGGPAAAGEGRFGHAQVGVEADEGRGGERQRDEVLQGVPVPGGERRGRERGYSIKEVEVGLAVGVQSGAACRDNTRTDSSPSMCPHTSTVLLFILQGVDALCIGKTGGQTLRADVRRKHYVAATCGLRYQPYHLLHHQHHQHVKTRVTATLHPPVLREHGQAHHRGAAEVARA